MAAARSQSPDKEVEGPYRQGERVNRRPCGLERKNPNRHSPNRFLGHRSQDETVDWIGQCCVPDRRSYAVRDAKLHLDCGEAGGAGRTEWQWQNDVATTLARRSAANRWRDSAG